MNALKGDWIWGSLALILCETEIYFRLGSINHFRFLLVIGLDATARISCADRNISLYPPQSFLSHNLPQLGSEIHSLTL